MKHPFELRIKTSFIYGFFTAIVIIGLFQDYLGQKEYIKYVQEAWINIDYRLWFIPLFILLSLQLNNILNAKKLNNHLIDIISDMKDVHNFFKYHNMDIDAVRKAAENFIQKRK